MLQTWVTDGVIIPVDKRGVFPDNEKYTWETRRLSASDIPSNIQVVRLIVLLKVDNDEVLHVDLAAPNSGSNL